MLFFNFLCLFYLMVLVENHTISKSIAKDDEIINVIDSIHDLENDKEHDVKQNRFHIRNGYQEDINFHKSWTPKYTKLDSSLLSSDNINVTRYVQVTGKSNEPLVTKSQRKGFFERLIDRLKGKKKKQFISNDMMARIRIQSTAPRAQKHPVKADKRDNITKDNDKGYLLLKQRSRRKKRSKLDKRQGDFDKKTVRKVINYDSSNRSWANTVSSDESPITTDKLKKGKRHLSINDNYTWRNNFPFTTMKPSQQTFTEGNDLSLTELTTKLDHLKEIYNMKTDPYTSLMSVMMNPNGPYNFNKFTTPLSEDMDKYMVETSEIEAILNNIKMNAIETITKGFITELGMIPFSYRSTKSATFKNNMKRNLNTSRNISNYVNVDELKKTLTKRKTSEDAASYGVAADTKQHEQYETEVDNDKPLENIEINTQPTNPMTTDFKDLAEKLYYNDYVNGYKHYLKFQQEQGVQNYSNLVRYQAHRHHSVDDIGKFILNKLPTVPKRYKRAFYDAAETTEDQDISTKSEESWFKKHFYVFIDSGQPKKYHSSQTVSLRPMITENNKSNNKFDSSRCSATIMNDNDNLIATTDQQRQSEDADLDQLANVLKMYKTQTTSALEKVLKHGLKMGCESNNIAENVNTKLYDRNEKYDDKYDKNTSTEVNIDLLLESVLHRPVRNLQNDDTDNEYQLYRSYLPDLELDALKELSSDRPRKMKKKSGKFAYVDLNVVTQPTAVVNLRNTGHDSRLRKFLNHLRFRFHKNKKNQKSILKKRDSPRTIKSLNPLKKLKKMFNVRIDGKPDVVLSKMFDYDMLDTHVNQFKSMKYNKPPPNLDDIKMDIPTVIPESSKLKSFTKDLPFKTTVPKKYFPHTSCVEKNDVPCGNETVMTEPCPILMTTKVTPPPTSTIYRTLTGSARNRPDFNDADFINIKVTTVKTLNDYTTQGIYDYAVSPYKAVRNKINDINLIRRFTALVRPNKMAKENLQRIYLSSINSDDEIIDTGKYKNNGITHSRILPTTESHFFSYIQLNDDSQPFNLDNSSTADNIVRQAQLVTMPLYEVSPRMKKHRLISSKRRKFSNSRRRYQTTPNYLNDLEMWHNDILDSDKYTTWQNILKNIQQPYMYKPPDMTALKSELHRLDKLLDIKKPVGGEKLKSKIKQFEQATKMNKTSPKNAETNEEFLIKKIEKSYQDNHKIRRRNIAAHDMNPLSRSEVRLEVPGLLSTQYRGILHPSFFVTHSVQIEDPAKSKSNPGNTTVKESATASDVMLFDTTLLAYDDSLNILKEVREETTAKTSHHALSPVNILTKLHKVPEQHFSTPLPMRNEDFENFLRDNNIDVKSVTSPVYFPSPDSFKSDLQAKGSVVALDPILYNQTTESVHVLDPKNATHATNQSTTATPKRKLELSKTFSEVLPINKMDDGRPRATTDKYKLSYSPLVHNNLLYHSKSDKKQEVLGKEKNTAGDAYKPSKGNNDFIDHSDSKQSKNYFDYDLYTNAKKMDVTTKTSKYDFILDDIASNKIKDKRNGKHDISSQRLKVFGNSGFYSKNIQEFIRDRDVLRRPKRRRKRKRRQMTIDQDSGVAEPRSAMDLMSGDRIRRIPSADADRNEVADSKASQKTTMEPRRGTIIYDLKQLSRPRAVAVKPRRGPFKKGTSVFAMEQNQIEVSINDSIPIIIPSTTVRRSMTTTTATTKSIATVPLKSSRSTTTTTAKTTLCKSPYATKRGDKPQTTPSTPVKTTTEKPMKLTECTNSHTQTSVVKEKLTKTTTPVTTRTKLNPKQTVKTKTSDHRFVIITTKIFSKKIENKAFNGGLLTNALPTISMAKLSNENITSATTEITKKSKCPTINSTLPSLKITVATSPTVSAESSVSTTESSPKTSTTPFTTEDMKELDEESLYITSNYYDYHTADMDYNEDDNKFDTTTKIKNNTTNKHLKRDVKSQNTFTAKDVAAIEVIVDLMRKNRNLNENEIVGAFNEIANKSTIAEQSTKATQPFVKSSDGISNSIQVHIAIPCNISIDKKRSLSEPVRIRKVFTARLSTPVDIEYQIHSVEDVDPVPTEAAFVIPPKNVTTSTNSTDIPNISNLKNCTFTVINEIKPRADKLSPGLYVLVENQSIPDGQYILKAVDSGKLLSDFNIKDKLSDVIVTPKGITSPNPNNLSKVTLSKDFIAVVNKHLMELYQYLMTTKDHKRKLRKVDTKLKRSATINHRRQRREINWDTIKKYIGHDKVCYCHCKPNRTMCRACAASDAVISELIFELDNLAQYMNDHCTEIQTYFWVNPSGGRKLRDAVHRIDKTLYDYFKRVSGKCKGRPCKVFMYMDKRDFVNPDNKSNYIGEPLIHDVEKLADHLEKALKYNIGDENLLDSGTKCLDVITKCMHLKSFNKRANEGENRRIKNVYSLDNVNVNIICKSDKLESTQKSIFDSTLGGPPYLTATPGILYYDDAGDYVKDDVKKKGIKALLTLKGYPKKKRKDKNHWFPYNVTPSIGNIAKKNVKKRYVRNEYQIESPLSEEGIESRWFNFLKGKKYQDQLADEAKNLDDNFKYLSDNKTENVTSTTENSNKFDFDQDDATVQSVDRYYSIAAYTLYKKVLSDVSHPRKRMKMSSIQPLKSKIKDPSSHLVNNFTPYKAIKPFSAKVRTIQSSKKTTHIQTAGTTKYHNKNFDANGRNVTKEANLISVTNAVNNYEENLRKNLQKYSFSRLKEATINYLDASNGTRVLVTTATTPISGHKHTTASNTITIRSSFTKKRPAIQSHKLNNKDVTISEPATSTNLPSTPKPNLVKVPLKNTQSKDELLFGGTTMNAVTKDNKELLLSILDFETNKLNEEWQKIALRKTAQDEDDDGQSFFQLHSEVFMTNEKPQQHKETDLKGNRKESDLKDGKSVTALNMGHGVVANKSPYNKHNQEEHRPQLVTKTSPSARHHATPASPTTDTYYDIRKDLPSIELQPPPDTCRSKPCHGLLDKFLDKFKFKMLPGTRKEKVAKTHQNGPKGRALKRKLDHGKRVHNKASNENNSEAENSTNPVTEAGCPPESPCDNIEDKKVPQAAVNKTAASAAAPAKNVNKQQQHGPKMNENLKKTKTHSEAEVHEPSCVRGPLCDIDATIIHVIDMYKKLPATSFRTFVKNITCYAYKNLPSIFQLRDTTKTKKSRHGNEQGSKIWRWNWVRGKRSTKNNFADIPYRNDVDYDYIDDDNKRMESKYPVEKIQYILGNNKEDYDKLYLGTDGVYRGRENERRKRKTIDMTSVVNGLTNLPPLRELVDEIFVIRGKSISIFCNVSGTPVYSVSNLTNMFRYTWTAERKSMLSAPNLKVVGPSLVLTGIEPRNFGTYTCSQDKIVARSVRVNVIEIPDFNIVFTPLYKCLGECTYEDLENIQNLGQEIQKSANCCGIVTSSARVDHPISLSDQQNEDLLKPTVVITAVAPPGIECGPECRRDLTCSIALLWASNAPALTTVKVVIIYDKFNNTLTPVDSNMPKMSISKKLKTKDSNGHREYLVLSRSMSPGDVDVVVACPAGYYLLTDQKICAVCPANTCAAAGENTCAPCPRGTHAEPGAAACRLGLSRLHSRAMLRRPAPAAAAAVSVARHSRTTLQALPIFVESD